ncbi:MAG: TonB-dependent receptor plug domain-containing protein, partial [Pseudomonadota bacterium]
MKLGCRLKFFFILLFLAGPWGRAQEIQVPTVVIDGGDGAQSPINPFSTFKSEKVNQDKFKEPARQTLADLVKDQVGVDTQVYCANCGAKRLTINGLKGEHTSILVDGLPLHSAVSSFYGVDNVPVNGLESVEVMRGAGASLTNPEAIGGTLNLVTINPLAAKNQYSTSLGVDDNATGKSQNHNFLYNFSNKKDWGLSVGGQWARNETWDEDQNNVSESPQRQNFSLMTKARFLLGDKNDISLRLGFAELEILGGFSDPTRPDRVRPLAAQESDFVDGNVEKKFIGDPIQITDWIDIDRREAALSWTSYLTGSTTMEHKVGYARQEQQAIYQHGFDYAHVDNLFVGDFGIAHSWNESHLSKIGFFFKDQRLRSASETLFDQFPASDPRDIARDSFDFTSQAIYAQHSIFLTGAGIEMDFALRADNTRINWLELDNEVSEFVLAPRFQFLQNFTDHLSQRFSYGLGYRSPLTFFESQHGNNENGYEVDITELEKAHSLVYSLSLNEPDYYITAGVHYTYLENMAFGFESINNPIFYRNSEEDFEIWVADLLTGFKPYSWWLLEASYEYFQYDDGYKRLLPTAAIEDRVQLRSSLEKGRWKHIFAVNIVGSRDLSKYASYNEYYVDRNQAAEPVLDPNLELKNQTSPQATPEGTLDRLE